MEIRQVAAQHTLAIRFRSAPQDLMSSVPAALKRVGGMLAERGIAPAGPAYARYLEHNPEGGYFEVEAGVPVAAAQAGMGDVVASKLPEGMVLCRWHTGPYDSIGESHRALERDVAERGFTPIGGPWESYVVSPADEPDASRWRTELCQEVGET